MTIPLKPVDPRPLTYLAAFTALAIAGRIAFLSLPNVALTYFVVFFSGVVLGARLGALVGLLSMTVTNIMLSGLHPVFLVNGPAMAVLGLLGALMRPLLVRPHVDAMDRVLRATLLVSAGAFGTFLFSILSDLGGYLLQYWATPEGRSIGVAALGPYLLAGLLFNLVPAVVNGALFVVLTVPLLRVLERAGTVRVRRPLAESGRAGRDRHPVETSVPPGSPWFDHHP